MMWITPSLRVVENDWEGDLVAPEDALGIIKDGGIADVGSLDAARFVMANLGMDQAQMDDRIHFALTGETLGVR